MGGSIGLLLGPPQWRTAPVRKLSQFEPGDRAQTPLSPPARKFPQFEPAGFLFYALIVTLFDKGSYCCTLTQELIVSVFFWYRCTLGGTILWTFLSCLSEKALRHSDPPIPVPIRILPAIGLDPQPYRCLFSATGGVLKPNDP